MFPNWAFKVPVRKLLKNFFNKGHGQFIERKKEIFFQTFEKYR